MKFKVTQKNLNDCLKNVAPFADKGHQLDIIKNILLKTNKNLLEVSATNLDTSIVERVQGSCSEEGSITVPTSLFRDYVQNLPADEKIELQLDDKKLTVTCKSTKAVVNGLSPENYPNFPVNKKLKPFLEIEAGHFRDDLAQVVFAANKDISRPILTGVFLHVFENEFYLAATDGYRLAEKKVVKALNKPPAKASEMQVLIPGSAVMGLERVLAAQPAKKISLYKEEDEKNILFIVGDGEIEITALPLEGTYPDYRKLLPEKFSTEITVDRNELVNAVKRAGLFSQEGPSSVILNWEAKKDRLNIKSSASQVGGNDEDVEAEVKVGDKGDTTIVLNSRYLQDVLGVMNSRKVKLGLNSKLDPCLLTGCEGSKGEQLDDGYRHAIMPLKP